MASLDTNRWVGYCFFFPVQGEAFKTSSLGWTTKVGVSWLKEWKFPSKLQLYFIRKLPIEVHSRFLLPCLSSSWVCLRTSVFSSVLVAEWLHLAQQDGPRCAHDAVSLCLCWWVSFFKLGHGQCMFRKYLSAPRDLFKKLSSEAGSHLLIL